MAPVAPTLSDTDPDSPANDNAPRIKGEAVAGSTVRLYTDASCTVAVAAMGSAAEFASPGLMVVVPDDSSTTFRATATEHVANTSSCSSSSITDVEDSTVPPQLGPGPTPPGQAPAGQGPASPAKLEVARARVLRASRRLDVLAPITARASGRIRVSFQAAGGTDRFTAAIDSADGRVSINRRIPASQARLGTGILTLSYPGDADTQPQEVRLRAGRSRRAWRRGARRSPAGA